MVHNKGGQASWRRVFFFPRGRKRQSIYCKNLIIRIGDKFVPFGRRASQQVSRGKRRVFREIVVGEFVPRCNIAIRETHLFKAFWKYCPEWPMRACVRSLMTDALAVPSGETISNLHRLLRGIPIIQRMQERDNVLTILRCQRWRLARAPVERGIGGVDVLLISGRDIVV